MQTAAAALLHGMCLPTLAPVSCFQVPQHKLLRGCTTHQVSRSQWQECSEAQMRLQCAACASIKSALHSQMGARRSLIRLQRHTWRVAELLFKGWAWALTLPGSIGWYCFSCRPVWRSGWRGGWVTHAFELDGIPHSNRMGSWLNIY